MHKFPTLYLKDWFINHRRALPWRNDPSPYQVWVSEVMLQQTQVNVVIPYYDRWISRYPTIESLALAPIEQVLKYWEGLGYYSRARYLHRGAQFVMEKFGGKIPDRAEDLALIPGIGPYTRGAMLSFAFRKKAVAMDGNVLRVLSRFTACLEEIDSLKTKKKIHNFAESILPDEEPWLITEGLIELGALICGKKPTCEVCPLKEACLSYQHHLQELIPKKKERKKIVHLFRDVAVIYFKDCFAVQKRENKLMKDLYEFPYLEGISLDRGQLSASIITEKFEHSWNLQLRYIQALEPKRHCFTRYRAQLFPHLLEAFSLGEGVEWKTLSELQTLPFSSGHKRILNEL